MNLAYISIGSNIEDRLTHLREAVSALHSNSAIEVLVISSIYETAPVGYTDQADFLNLVLQVETDLESDDLLEACQSVENELGRVRDIRWGPRTVDLDILLFNKDSVKTDNLQIPHPRMHERGFVLIPLLEIAPEIMHPDTEKLYAEQDAVHDEGVALWKKVNNLEQFLHVSAD